MHVENDRKEIETYGLTRGFPHGHHHRSSPSKAQFPMKTTPVSILLASILGTHATFAEDRPRKDGPGENGPGRGFMEAWKTADANGDRSLSAEEFASLPRLQAIPEDKRAQLFKRLDKDEDGQIAFAEMQRMGPPKPEGPHPHKRLWELDTDKSGGISLQEFSAGEMASKLPPERAQKLFERLDTNKDGSISPEDRPKHPEPRPDGPCPGKDNPRDPRPEDGKPGDNESPRHPNLFPKLDTNKDGSLDFDEFSQMPGPSRLGEDEREKIFEKADANKDLKISPEEMRGLRPPEHGNGKGPKGPRPDKPHGPPPGPPVE